MYNKINKIHLIGIGGIGMSGIAELLIRNGYSISGSDLGRGDNVRHLESLGAKIHQGHAGINLSGAELVVYSSAIQPSNPELIAAQSNGILTISRTEMLAELMRLKYGIAVAGAHGKTTTTSMIAIVLTEAEFDPTIVVGGRMDNFGGTNARLGSGEFMVVEADESDGSFNKLSPCIAVVTNMDREHMDHYGTMVRLKQAFTSFLNKVPFYGLSIFCGDDPYLKMIQNRISRRKKSFGFSPNNQYHVLSYVTQGETVECSIQADGTKERLRLRVPGRHNVLNALAALATADELSIPRSKSIRALENYRGVQRRFQKRGELRGVTFIDDYAHHPTEIRATLAAARDRFPGARVRVLFQPHRYTRTEDLFDQFSTCFKDCDRVGITEIYSAGESKIENVDSSLLVENIRRQGMYDAELIHRPLETIESWLEESNPGDVIITLGAGDLPNVYRELF